MAMTKEQLQERIEKSIIKIEKLEKKVNKYSNLVSQEFKDLVDEVLKNDDYSKLKEYNKMKHDAHHCQGDEYDYYHGKSDLEAAIKTYNNYIIKIKEMEQYESEEKIEVIWNFLTDWETKAYDWYIQNANLYMELYDKYDEVWEGSKEQYKYDGSYTTYDGKRVQRTCYNETRFRENYYFNIQSLTKLITNAYRKTIDTEKLAKVLKDEKDRKYKDLIQRVTKVVGKITDASMLKIGNQNGEINGRIKGENGTCIVETISAGGYNIQCFHYRVLINKIK